MHNADPNGTKELYGVLNGASNRRILKSTDQGTNWTLVVQMPGDSVIQQVAYDHIISRLYIAYGDQGYGKLYRYQNTVLTDISSRLPLDPLFNFNSAQCVAVDPADPRVVYVGRQDDNASVGYAVMRSTDSGTNWVGLSLQPGQAGLDGGGRGAMRLRVHPVTRQLWVSAAETGTWRYPAPNAWLNLKIMPMGDSITEGTIPGGYRLPLYNLLQAGGYSFDFVGAKAQVGDTCPDINHWGRSGWQISDTPAMIEGRSYVSIQGQNRSGLYDEMASAVTSSYFSTNAATRNIILLMIGVNDHLHQVVDSAHGGFNTDLNNDGQGEGQDWIAEGCLARLQALLHEIDTRAVSQGLQLEVLVSTIPPITKAWTGDAVSDVITNEVVQFNGLIRAAVPTNVFSNIMVKLVDQYTAQIGNQADGVHPNAAGYQAMGQVWYEAITNGSTRPTVTLTASTRNAAEPSTPAAFTINRAGSTSSNLTVLYTCSGTASNGADYSALSGSVTISTESSSAAVTIDPMDDSLVEGNETVVLTLVAHAAYAVGSSGSATVTIADNDAPAVTQATEPFDNAIDVPAHGWTGTGNTSNGNNFGFSNTDNTGFGSPAGEAGGVIARTANVSFYGDTMLGTLFTLTNTLHADGELAITAATTSPVYDNATAIGFFNIADAGSSARKNTLGLTLNEPAGTGGPGTYRVRPTFKLSSGAVVEPTGVISLTPGNSIYKFTFDYNPTNGVNSQGRLTVQMFNSSGVSLGTLSQDLNATQRATNATFNAFGLLTGGLGAANNADAITLFIDNVNYTSASANTAVPLLLSSPQRLGNGHFQFNISGGVGQPYVVQAARNLPDWISLRTNLLSNGFGAFIDTQAANLDRRMYRLQRGP